MRILGFEIRYVGYGGNIKKATSENRPSLKNRQHKCDSVERLAKKPPPTPSQPSVCEKHVYLSVDDIDKIVIVKKYKMNTH